VITKNNSISLHVAGLLGGAVDFLVQVSLPFFLLVFVALCIPLPKAFLANRVRRCFKTPYIASICWMLAFLRFACSIAATVVVTTLGPSLPPKWDWLFDATCMISVLVDIIIAASLCYHLAQGRKNSRSRRWVKSNVTFAMCIEPAKFPQYDPFDRSNHCDDYTWVLHALTTDAHTMLPATGIVTSVVDIAMLVCVSNPLCTSVSLLKLS
jgi:hypothetical protein